MNKGLVGLGPGSSLRTTSPSPPDRKELGLVIQSSDLAPAFSPASGSGKNKMKGEEDGDGEGQVLWPVPIDTSLRIGDPTNIDELTTNQPSSDATKARLSERRKPLRAHAPTPDAHAAARRRPPANPNRRAKPEPEVLATRAVPVWVEFWRLDTFKEKVRLRSHTVWYAGSLWNVYTQAVRKKAAWASRSACTSTGRAPSQSIGSTIVAPIPIPLSSVMFQSPPSGPRPMSMSTSTAASAGANTGRGRAQSEGESRLSGRLWRATTPVLIAPLLSSPSAVSVLAHPSTSMITLPSSISVVASANSSGSSGAYVRQFTLDLKKNRAGGEKGWQLMQILILRPYDDAGHRAPSSRTVTRVRRFLRISSLRVILGLEAV